MIRIMEFQVEMDQFALSFMSPECLMKYSAGLSFLDFDCGRQVFSKCVGYFIIVASIFSKFPQVKKIYSAKSGEGLPVPFVLMECLFLSSQFSFFVMKGLSFSIYGDLVFNFIVTVFIGFLCLVYSDRQIHGLLFAIFCFSGPAIMCSGHLPLQHVLWLSQIFMTCFHISIILGIIKNFRAKSTGQLSFHTMLTITVLIFLRILTILAETGDVSLVYGILVGFGLCLTTVIQIVIYAPKNKKE